MTTRSRILTFIALLVLSLVVLGLVTRQSSGGITPIRFDPIKGDAIWLSDSPRIRAPKQARIVDRGFQLVNFIHRGVLINDAGEVLFRSDSGPVDSPNRCNSLLYLPGEARSTALIKSPTPSGSHRSTIFNAEGKSKAFKHDVIGPVFPEWHLMSFYRYKALARRIGNPDELLQSILIDPQLREHTQFNHTRNAGQDDPRLLWASGGYGIVATPSTFSANTPNGTFYNLTTGEVKTHICSTVTSEGHQFERQQRFVTRLFTQNRSMLYDPASDTVRYEAGWIGDSHHDSLLIASTSRDNPRRELIDTDGRVLLRFAQPERLLTITRAGIALWHDRVIRGPSGLITTATRIQQNEDGQWAISPFELPESPVMPTQYPDRFVRGTPDGDDKALLNESLEVVFEIAPDEHPVYVTHDAGLVTYDEPEHTYILYSPAGEELKRFDMDALGFPKPAEPSSP